MPKLYPNAFRIASLTLITLFSCITFAWAAPRGNSFGQAPSIGLTGFDGGTGTSTSFGANQASPFTALNVLSSGFDVTAMGTGTNVTLTATGSAGYGTASPAGADNRYIRGQRASAAGSFSELDFVSDDGSAFNLQSIAVSATLITSTDQVKVVLTGFRSGTQVGSPVTVTVASSSGGVNWLPVTTNFSGIDEVKVAFSDNDNPSSAVGAGGVDALTLGGFSVVNPALSDGQAGVLYTAENFTVSGGTAPYSFAVVSGSLPAGISLSSSGTLSGTPTATGTFTFSVQATDHTSQTSAADPVSLTITAPTLGLLPTGLGDGVYKSTYNATTFVGSGGVASYTYSAVGLPPGMSINANSGVLSGTPTAAGTYSISVTVQDGTTGTGSPYTKTNVITLVIDKVPLTITANNATKVYGSANPSFSATYSGFAGGDNSGSLTTQPTFTTTATAASPVGGYPITGSGAVDANYTITYGTGTLTVGKATLTVTANNASMTYGSAVPSLGVSYSGFIGSDNSGSLTAQPIATTTAGPTSNVGAYPITVSGATAANYNITYVPGAMTVGPASVTVTPNNVSKAYGAAVPALSVGYSGFVNGQTASVLTTTPTVTTTASPASPVGSYPITASGAVAPNYTFSYLPGTLSVGTAVLTVTANNATMVYGSSVPPLSATYSGFVNGDAVINLGTPPTVTTTATPASAAGTYPITPAGATDPNYTITYAPGTLTVDPAMLNVTANAQTKAYGTPDPTLTYTVSGLVNGDNATIFSGGLTRAQGENVGTYLITEGTLTAGNNYIVNFTGNTLTITRAAQTITWTQSLLSGCNGVNQLQLTALASSGLPISYTSSNTNVATVSGDTLTLVAPGTSIITANQPGDANHLAATAVTETVIDQTPALVSQHWNDVLFFDNSSDNYVQWQWYKNGAAIPGAIHSYYSETPSLNGQYYVVATNNTGQQIQSCPLTVTPGSTIPGGIKVFPNPVFNGVAVNVVCNYTPAALQGAQMQIVDITGKVRQLIANVQPSMQVTMPSGSGIYIINLLLANGQKVSINVLVAE